MLLIHHLPEKIVKKFVVFNLCLLLSVITFCNISVLKCFADDSDERASESSRASYSIENITESITESITDITEPSEETTEIYNGEDVPEVFYDRFIVVLLIIILFVLIVSKLL